MHVSKIIEAARLSKSLSYEDVAKAVGITSAWARDLEFYDDEIPLTLSEAQVLALCGLLELDRRQLPASAEEDDADP